MDRNTAGATATDAPASGARRHRELSLKTNFSWTLVGQVIYTACQWAMLVVLAKLGSPEMVGRFALAFAVTAPVIMLTNLQLRAVQATDAREEYPFDQYFALRLITSSAAILVIAGIAAFSGYKSAVAWVIVAVGLAKTSESISDIIHGLAQQREQMDRIAISLVIKGTVSLAALAIVIYATKNLIAGTLALAISWAVVFATYDLRIVPDILVGKRRSRRTRRRTLRPEWNRPKLLRLAVLSLPLGVTMMLISLNANIPRYFVERFSGERELGIFAAMSYLMVAGSTVVAALSQSATPRMARHFADGDAKAFTLLLGKLSAMGAIVGLLGVVIAAVAGKWLLTVFYGPVYAQQTAVFVWIATATGLSYIQSFLGCGMTAARCFKVQAPLIGGAVIITAGLSLWLMPGLGLLGAAIAVTVSTAALTLGTFAVDVVAIRAMGEER